MLDGCEKNMGWSIVRPESETAPELLEHFVVVVNVSLSSPCRPGVNDEPGPLFMLRAGTALAASVPLRILAALGRSE